jgi:hypothetical protein
MKNERNKYCLESKVSQHAFDCELKNFLHVIDLNLKTNDLILWDITWCSTKIKLYRIVIFGKFVDLKFHLELFLQFCHLINLFDYK